MKPTNNSLEPLKNVNLTQEEAERILKNLRAVMKAEMRIEWEAELKETSNQKHKPDFSWAKVQRIAAPSATVVLVGGLLWAAVSNNWFRDQVRSPVATTFNQVGSTTNYQTRKTPVKPKTLHTFLESRDWKSPNTSPYKAGLTTVKDPAVPSAFEQSIRPKKGIATIEVSSSSGTMELPTSWQRHIEFNSDSFDINGQTYTLPAKYRNQRMFVLPIDKGIVWAPVTKMPSRLNQVQKASNGTESIYYTPYQPNGGSLATNSQQIGQLPHRWFGIDGPTKTTAWAGWLRPSQVAVAQVKSSTTYHVQYTKKSTVQSAEPVKGSIPGWPTLSMKSLSRKPYYAKAHYAAFIGGLTRTYGGFVLSVQFMDATNTGRNAGLSGASYYWSERTGKWTPLSQIYGVQTLTGGMATGSHAVYWIQPSPVGSGSGDELDVTEMYFNPATLTMKSVWLGNWFYWGSVVDGNSWLAVLPNDIQPSQNPNSPMGTPKKWTVYTP